MNKMNSYLLEDYNRIKRLLLKTRSPIKRESYKNSLTLIREYYDYFNKNDLSISIPTLKTI